MKTIFINASPKRRFSASSYFLELQRLFVRGDVISFKLRTRSDYKQILNELQDADTVVFCLPLYVDGVPSHMLPFLKEMENYCKQSNTCVRVYCIANNGFVEGKQNEPLMRVFQNFCTKSGLKWCGGIGIGGGVMLNITRILFFANAAVFAVRAGWNGIQHGQFVTDEMLRGFLPGMLIFVFLNLGVFIHIFRMSFAMNKEGEGYFGEKYTRILLPSFLFILIADLFFTITSIICGGIFRGWLSGKGMQ